MALEYNPSDEEESDYDWLSDEEFDYETFDENDYKYGLYKGNQRYAMDQIPLEFGGGACQTIAEKGKQYIVLAGAKVDLGKRQATLQLTFRADGLQVCKPAIIFRLKPKIENEKINVREPSQKLRNDNYDERVAVYFDAKAWGTRPVLDAWLEDFHAETRNEPSPKMLQTDNLDSQSHQGFQDRAKAKNIKMVYSPGDCTDVCSVVDKHIGYTVKKYMKKRYIADLNSSEARLTEWKNGKVSAYERRNLYTLWLADGWEYIHRKPGYIMHCFKKCGLYNDMDGKENNLVELKKGFAYRPPKKSDPRARDPNAEESDSDEEIEF